MRNSSTSVPLHVTQVDAATHYTRRYMTLPRMITHWHQANEVTRTTPSGGEVLEIGPGSGHTTWLLRQWGYAVTTLDFDPKVSADIVGDVTRLPLQDGAVDCVIAAEVLEHIPFEEFEVALRELRRVSRKSVIVTLPAPFLGISALWNWPLLEPRGLFIGVPYVVKHAFNGEHYWELGKRGYGVRKISRKITESGLRIVRAFRPPPSLYCYFFVCERAT
jgi:ubiquinone/menaquinone biosynthesis C-methylase UbiE